MRLFFISSFLIISYFTSFGQTRCKGRVVDSVSGHPVEFANIGVLGKGLGTVSNEKGEYDFMLPDSVKKEKIRVSIIGYKPKTIAAVAFSAMQDVKLAQDVSILQEVSVKAKKIKVKILGHEARGSVSAGFSKNNLGAEMAVKLNIRHPQTHLRKFMVNIHQSTLEKAMFRLNIYNKDKDGNPGENILKQMIIIEPVEKTGLITVDLLPYHIYADDDVFVALEWIKDLGDAKGLLFSSRLVGSGTWFRQASQDKWQKVPSIGVGFHVEAAY